MILSTHIVIAAAAAKPFAALHPLIPFAIALLSHFLSDTIPHWDYRLKSMKDPDDPETRHWEFARKTITRDFLWLLGDGLLGVGMVALAFQPKTPAEFLFAGAVIAGAVLPDFLEGLYTGHRFSFLKPIHTFHHWIHSKITLCPYPWIGIPLQILIFLTAFGFLIL